MIRIIRIIRDRAIANPFGMSVFAFLLMCCSAWAQQYKGWPLNEKLAEEEAKKARAVSVALQSGSVDQATFDTYFKKYYFHRWTQPENLTNLNTFVRKDFLDGDLHKATATARTNLLRLSIAVMKKMKSDVNVSPAVRYNAVVVLGLLYEDAGKTKLFAPALPLLLEEFNDPKASDANKIAALNGIVRFAYLGIDDEKLRKETVSELFRGLATQSAPPEGRETEIHQLFFRAKALQGLGALCRNRSEELNQATLDALLKLTNDATERVEIRYGAAMALSEINYAKASGVRFDSTYIYETIGSFMLYACEAEREYNAMLRRTEQASSSTARGGTGTSSMGSSDYDTGSSMMSSSSSGGPGVAKDNNRLDQSMRRSKLAFGIVTDMIKGAISDRTDETNFLGLLKKENTPESTQRIEALESAVKIAADYTKFLKSGPAASGRPSPSRSGGSGSGRTAAANLPKVTMMDIYYELEAISGELEGVFGPLLATTPGPGTDPETGQTPIEEDEIDFDI